MYLRKIYRNIGPLIAAGLYYSGLVPLARLWARHSGRRLIILNYHRADENLRRHLLYLRRHYRILPLETALDELYESTKSGTFDADARTPLAITFDDGYHDNYVYADTLARELQVPITIFLPPGYVDSGARFHWLEGEYLAHHAQVDKATIAGRTYYLGRPDDRRHLLQALDAHVRYARSVNERESFLTTARSALAISSDVSANDKLALPLTWTEVREMESGGWVTYGAHTVHHPLLACLAESAEVEHEIGDSRKILEQRIGRSVRTFAYPYGKPRDIGVHAIRAVREAGFSWAVTTIPGCNTLRTDRYLLRRVPTDSSESWLMLAAQTAGVWWILAQALMHLLGIPTDTAALPRAPLFRYRMWKKAEVLACQESNIHAQR